MPYIFITSWFPGDLVFDVAKKIPEALKVLRKFNPEDLWDDLIPNAIRSTQDGIVNITVSKIKSGKLDVAMTALQKYYAQFITIPGFKFEMKVWATTEEAFGAVDLKPPE